jgi:FkbM family methyltransferase
MLRKARKLVELLRVPSFARALRYNCAASVEHQPLMKTLALRTVVDAGANRGQFSLLIRHLFPEATIHAFEPQQMAADIYQRLFRNDSLCRLHRCALGITRGQVTMNVSNYDASSSILPIGKLHVAWLPHTYQVGTETVDIARLDEFLSAEDVGADALLKIDVQGYELQVLEGAGSLLPRFRYVFCEVSFAQLYEKQDLAHSVVTYLLDRGFEFSCVSQVSSFKHVPVQADILFARK